MSPLQTSPFWFLLHKAEGTPNVALKVRLMEKFLLYMEPLLFSLSTGFLTGKCTLILMPTPLTAKSGCCVAV